MYEIEIKAWLRNKDSIVDELKKRLGSPAAYTKSDSYYEIPLANDLVETVRVRKVDEQTSCTLKSKNIVDSMEVSEEFEFFVSSSNDLLGFIKKLGGVEVRRKVKTGLSFKDNDITIEISTVSEIGDFIEIETIAHIPTDEVLHNSKTRLKEYLFSLGISPDDIEPKTYMQLQSEIDDKVDFDDLG